MSDRRYASMKTHALSLEFDRITACGLYLDEFDSAVATGGREFTLKIADKPAAITCKRCACAPHFRTASQVTGAAREGR